MARPPNDPFQRALAALRERLRSGAYAPGARVTATDLADELRLSATPVREALSRLAGEGLVEERRGLGFFIRPLGSSDVSDLYRLSLAHLLIAQDPHRQGPRRAAAALDGNLDDPVRAVELLFLGWVHEAASVTLEADFRRNQVQIGPVRRLEPMLIPDLAAEAAALGGLPGEAIADRLQRIRHFHARRLRLADRLAGLLGHPGA